MNFTGLLARLEGTALSPLRDFVSHGRLARIRHGDFRRLRSLVDELPRLVPSVTDFGARVMIGSPADCDEQAREELRRLLMDFAPWRKGPFELFGIDLDAEWRSELKWARLDGKIASLDGRKVLDVGCGNGYYCFRMLGRGASEVVGLDSHIPYVMQFWALKSFVPEAQCWVLPMAMEEFPSGSGHFDTVFSMGVLYHVRSPLDHLLQLREALRPGGELVLETLHVEGGEGYCLTPRERYARMRNVWFLPSIATLQNWLQRCGFSDARILDLSVTTPAEQRSTAWMPFDSLADSLDPRDPARTVESHPAPARLLLAARRAA